MDNYPLSRFLGSLYRCWGAVRKASKPRGIARLGRVYVPAALPAQIVVSVPIVVLLQVMAVVILAGTLQAPRRLAPEVSPPTASLRLGAPGKLPDDQRSGPGAAFAYTLFDGYSVLAQAVGGASPVLLDLVPRDSIAMATAPKLSWDGQGPAEPPAVLASDHDVNEATRGQHGVDAGVATVEDAKPGTKADARDAVGPAASGTGKVESRDLTWLKRQNPRHLTLQLLSARQLQPLESLVRRNGLQGDLVYVRSIHQGATLYSLVYGVYTSTAEANKAAKAFQFELKLQPWVRTVASIQAQVAAAGSGVASIDRMRSDE